MKTAMMSLLTLALSSSLADTTVVETKQRAKVRRDIIAVFILINRGLLSLLGGVVKIWVILIFSIRNAVTIVIIIFTVKETIIVVVGIFCYIWGTISVCVSVFILFI